MSGSPNDVSAVTVVIPTRNRADLLAQTIESVLGQQQVNISVVVVDDASTDHTAEVLQRFPSISVVRQARPTEQRKARNDGAELVRTEWIAFCDDDDLWAPDKLRRQLDALQETNADWCTCSALFVDESLQPIGGQRLACTKDMAGRLIRQNVVPGGGSGVVVRTEVFRQVGGFRDDARYVEDWDLWIRLARRGAAANVDRLLVAQRQWSRSFSHMDIRGQYQAFMDVTRRYGGQAQKPRNAGYFEIRQRLRSGSRWRIWFDLPRILRASPEDLRWALIMLMLPGAALRRLDLRLVGLDDVATAESWLQHHRRHNEGALT